MGLPWALQVVDVEVVEVNELGFFAEAVPQAQRDDLVRFLSSTWRIIQLSNPGDRKSPTVGLSYL